MRLMFYYLRCWTAIICCVVLHFFLALVFIFTPNLKKNHRKLARFFIKIIAKALKLRVLINGIANVPTNQPCIFMANHSSLIDILVMTIAIPYHFNFIAKKELIWVPFIGLDMVLGGDFLIDRTNPRKAKQCLDNVEKRLKKGWNMLIFPEGTRSENGHLLPFKRGAFKLAINSGAVIIPCYIHGSGSIVQKNSLTPRPGNVHIYFSSAITPPTSKETSKDAMSDLMLTTRKEIQKLQERHAASH